MSGNSSGREPNAKSSSDEFEQFSNFARQILSVPHSEIKAQIDAEKAAKRTAKASSRVSGEPSNPS
jgi:hypothetical protein